MGGKVSLHINKDVRVGPRDPGYLPRDLISLLMSNQALEWWAATGRFEQSTPAKIAVVKSSRLIAPPGILANDSSLDWHEILKNA